MKTRNIFIGLYSYLTIFSNFIRQSFNHCIRHLKTKFRGDVGAFLGRDEGDPDERVPKVEVKLENDLLVTSL